MLGAIPGNVRSGLVCGVVFDLHNLFKPLYVWIAADVEPITHEILDSVTLGHGGGYVCYPAMPGCCGQPDNLQVIECFDFS